ncbi:MAG: aminodeoxychorismate synthase component I [Candidatus Omnitrophica bacterium]|nr:aminodeoxychorismate synthase component I [Candidatus Omnitrophota bacterium]
MEYYILRSYKLKADAFSIFTALNKEKNCFFLDSSLSLNGCGRFSFFGIDPFLIVKTKNEDPFVKLKEALAPYENKPPKNNIPFLGGAVGYLAYDLGVILEKKIKRKNAPSLDIPDSFFAFYNNTIVIDHRKNLLYIFCVGYPEKSYRKKQLLAESNFKKISDLICNIGSGRRNKSHRNADPDRPVLSSNFTKSGYISAVKKAKAYIKAGDIYQVNLSQQFSAKSSLSALLLYQRLRQLSPSSFSAYFDAGSFQILSSSPERFLKLSEDKVITSPMKGTRPRSSDKSKDIRLRKELLESPKDKAELLMIVDLERNDLGRVCDYDSIRVRELRSLEEYRTVFQTTATVEGRLHKSKDRIDLLRACFPGGSITGCPKIRSMEIIEELEPDRRSVYTGCLGYLSFSGGMDFNILIRTILKKGEDLYFNAGGGIVADSLPDKEYEETLVKAKAMMKAISAL